MTSVARLLIIIAAVFLAVNPAMACCFSESSHGAPAAEQSAPPCHGEDAPVTEDERSDYKWASCPGCSDCDTVVFESPLPPDSPLVVINISPDPIDGLYETHIPPKVLVDRMSTGPPSGQVSSFDTPLTLKQQLLI